MKFVFLITLFIFLNNSCFTQEYTYSFGIENVTNLAEAKEATAIFRSLFTSEDESISTFPKFDNDLQRFYFLSEIAVNEDDLRQLLTLNSYILTTFKRSSNNTIIKAEKE